MPWMLSLADRYTASRAQACSPSQLKPKCASLEAPVSLRNARIERGTGRLVLVECAIAAVDRDKALSALVSRNALVDRMHEMHS